MRMTSFEQTVRHPVSTVISACEETKAEIWRHSSSHIVEHISAARYEVIVPDRDVSLFKELSAKPFVVVAESTYLNGRDIDWLKSRFPESLRDRSGWYLQQFIKITAARARLHEEIVLIWDADTVPLKSLTFADDAGRLIYYTSDEYHLPYFAMIRSLLRLERIVPFSFIAQCFAVKPRWVDDFCREIEMQQGMHWIDAILQQIDFKTISGFSEYESLGTYLTHRHRGEMLITRKAWQRYGNALIGSVSKLTAQTEKLLAAHYDFVSFEHWDTSRRSQQGQTGLR
jgi:hypothetical protein